MHPDLTDINIGQLKEQLQAITHRSLFADVIRAKPLESLFMIKQQIHDNRVVVVDIIGNDLVILIEQL